MSGNRDEKRKQEELRRQQEADRALFLQSFNEARKPSPLQEAWERQNLDFLNWENSRGAYEGKPLDITNAPGMGPSLALYNRAAAGQQGERQGQGLITMGLSGNSQLTDKLAQQSKARREQEAAGALENAVAMKTAEAHGSVLPLSALHQSRTMGLAGMAGNQAGGSTGLWANYRVPPGYARQFGSAFSTTLGSTLGRFAGGGGGGGGGFS